MKDFISDSNYPDFMEPDGLIRQLNAIGGIKVAYSNDTYSVHNTALMENFPCIFSEGVLCTFTYEDKGHYSKIHQEFVLGSKYSNPDIFRAHFKIEPFRSKYFHGDDTIEELADEILDDLRLNQVAELNGDAEKITSTIIPFPQIISRDHGDYRTHHLTYIELVAQRIERKASILPEQIKELSDFFLNMLEPGYIIDRV